VGPNDLVEQLNDPNRLVRTGVVQLPPEQIPLYRTLATQWGASVANSSEVRLARAPQGSRFLGISSDSILEDLNAIATKIHDRRTVVLANIDLLLARLNEAERVSVWRFLFTSFRRRPTGLLLLMPSEAEHLFPAAEARLWEEAGRLCSIAATHSAAGATTTLWED
jgi:hypothetical protein